jgi:group I intron endonuclease
MQSGIYAITNMLNGYRYIGGTTDITRRWKVHISQLRHNKHKNERLQNAWNKDGSSIFNLEVLELCENVAILTQKEQFYLDLLQPEYNLVLTVVNTASKIGIPRTGEIKNKISRTEMGKSKGMWRRQLGIFYIMERDNSFSSDVHDQGERNPRSRLSKEQVIAIRQAYSTGEVTQEILSRKYGVGRTQIGKIVRGERWL